jgi:hypothetical protein
MGQFLGPETDVIGERYFMTFEVIMLSSELLHHRLDDENMCWYCCRYGSIGWTLKLWYSCCQNTNSTNNSIVLNLRLDYILTERSTHPTPPTTNYLLLLLTAPASQATHCTTIQLQYSAGTMYYVAQLCIFPANTILIFFVSEFKQNYGERSSGYQLDH